MNLKQVHEARLIRDASRSPLAQIGGRGAGQAVITGSILSSAFPICCFAICISKLFCKFIQTSGVVPNALASRNAVSAVTSAAGQPCVRMVKHRAAKLGALQASSGLETVRVPARMKNRAANAGAT
jgi:hypothetical protein